MERVILTWQYYSVDRLKSCCYLEQGKPSKYNPGPTDARYYESVCTRGQCYNENIRQTVA